MVLLLRYLFEVGHGFGLPSMNKKITEEAESAFLSPKEVLTEMLT